MDNSSEKFDGRICMLFFCFYIRALQILSLVGTPLISFFILQKLQKVQESHKLLKKKMTFLDK